jgi:hypothetical protein
LPNSSIPSYEISSSMRLHGYQLNTRSGTFTPNFCNGLPRRGLDIARHSAVFWMDSLRHVMRREKKTRFHGLMQTTVIALHLLFEI